MKKYQPGRTDFLINREWGIPADQLSKEEAVSRKMKLFHGRWVTTEERKRLREEYGAYQSVRMIGGLLIVLPLFLLINIGGMTQAGIITAMVALIYGAAMLAAGIGLVQFRLIAWKIAVGVFCSFLVLPFAPFLSDDKGAPLIVILGLAGMYYLMRRGARKIFAPLSRKNAGNIKPHRSHARKAVYAALLLLGVLAIYTFYDARYARLMAVDVCSRAVQGMPLEDFYSTLSTDDYKMIKRSGHAIVVPKRGMGRHSCTVSHDGQKITGAKTGFVD